MGSPESSTLIPVSLRFNTDQEKLVKLCKLYWEFNSDQGFLTKSNDLARQFDMSPSQLARLVTEACDAISCDEFCIKCGAAYIYSSRTDFQQRSRKQRDWVCQGCQRKERNLRETERIIAEKAYRACIEQRYESENPGPVELSDMSLENAVYLLSFIRLCAAEDFSVAVSLESVKRSLGPTSSMGIEILRQLCKADLIRVSPKSVVEAFEGKEAERFYLDKVLWNLPIGYESDKPKDFASELEEAVRGDVWPIAWQEERVLLWQKVALQECLQYLEFTLGEHGLNHHVGEKTILVFNNLIQDFSVAQIYGFIWRAAKDAAAFYVRERVSKQHAANTVVGSIQRQGERAKAEGWDIKCYGRVWGCPQSVLSEVLFNAVLRIGDDGFNKVPRSSALS